MLVEEIAEVTRILDVMEVVARDTVDSPEFRLVKLSIERDRG